MDCDENGNIISVKTYKYKSPVTQNVIIPSFYQVNLGNREAKMVYNSTKDYRDIYSISVGQTPSLTFKYTDITGGFEPLSVGDNNLDEGLSYDELPIMLVIPPTTYIPNMTTTCIGGNLDTSKEGYYYNLYKATDGLNYYIKFKVIIKVGNPTTVPVPPIESVSYLYINPEWKDQLESYTVLEDGVTTTSNIEYDNQGNPTSITNFYYRSVIRHHATFEWDGRQLTKITVYSTDIDVCANIEYKYNDQGYRTEKIVNGYSTKYFLEGDKVLYETNGTYGIIFTYDYDGTLISFNYDSDINNSSNETKDYFYIRNISGDITHIVDYLGNEVVKYVYDAYGNIVSVIDNSGSSISNINPYRYKGYRYDSEINMYYLNSRFYNPQIGRFLNADGLLGEMSNIQSTNMYAYCVNNPVMYSDISGYAPEWIKNLTIGLLVICTLAVLTIASAGTLTAAGAAFVGAFTGSSVGGLAGFFAAATFGSAVTAFVGGTIAGGVSLLNGESFVDGFSNGFKSGAITGAIAGGFGEMLSPLMANTFKAQGFLNGTISMSITAFQGAKNDNFSLLDTVASFGFGYIGAAFRNVTGLKALFTGIGLSIAEVGVTEVMHYAFPNALIIDWQYGY